MNPTVQEMLREAAADLVAQTEAAKARAPLTIALRELEEAKVRIAALEAHITNLEHAGMHAMLPDANVIDRKRWDEAVRKRP
jgi:hypothetical protein